MVKICVGLRVLLLAFNYLNSNISQGSVATCFRWGGIFNDRLIANLLLNVTAWEPVNIWLTLVCVMNKCFTWVIFDAQRSISSGQQLITATRKLNFCKNIIYFYSESFVTPVSEIYKKFSYRRETARQLCMSTWASWLTDRAMHRTPQNRRGCNISDIQTLWFKNCWPKTHFVMK